MNTWTDDDRTHVFFDWETLISVETDVDGVTIQLPSWALDQLIQLHQDQ